MAPDGSNMLPNTPGPKLKEFKNGKFNNIKFLKGMGSGNHSHVWKTEIDGEIYALKLFRNIRAWEENFYNEDKLKNLNVDEQLVDDQLSPFNCEARAYGRLHETGNEDLAWKCYGWIALDEETYSNSVWGVIGLQRYQWFSYAINSDEEVADRELFPIYALVKEFIPAERMQATRIDPAKAHDMAVAVSTLHRIGITHRDIQKTNYVDCRFTDFSTSWTVPNVRLDRQLGWDPKATIDQNETDDYFYFDTMWEKWNKDNPDKQCDYRTTLKETTRRVRVSLSQRSASESSQEDENIPTMERFIDASVIYLASGYDWQKGTHSGPLRPQVSAPAPLPGPKGVNDGGPAPQTPAVQNNQGAGGTKLAGPPSIRVPSRAAYRGPDPKLPRFTMLWSWSAHPPAPNHGGLDAEKLEEIRRYAAEIIRESKRLKACCATIDGLMPRAQSIIRTIDGFDGSSVGGSNSVKCCDDNFFTGVIDALADDDGGVNDDHDENERSKKRPRKL